MCLILRGVHQNIAVELAIKLAIFDATGGNFPGYTFYSLIMVTLLRKFIRESDTLPGTAKMP